MRATLASVDRVTCAVSAQDVGEFDESMRSRIIEQRPAGPVGRIEIRAVRDEQRDHLAQPRRLGTEE